MVLEIARTGNIIFAMCSTMQELWACKDLVEYSLLQLIYLVKHVVVTCPTLRIKGSFGELKL